MDNTTEMLQEWLAAVGSDYAAVVWRPEGEPRWRPEGKGSGRRGSSCHSDRERDSTSHICRPGPCPVPAERERRLPRGIISSLYPLRSYPDEECPKHWTKERYQFLMELKQEALTFARGWGADYILVRKPGLQLGFPSVLVSVADRKFSVT